MTIILGVRVAVTTLRSPKILQILTDWESIPFAPSRSTERSLPKILYWVIGKIVSNVMVSFSVRSSFFNNVCLSNYHHIVSQWMSLKFNYLHTPFYWVVSMLLSWQHRRQFVRLRNVVLPMGIWRKPTFYRGCSMARCDKVAAVNTPLLSLSGCAPGLFLAVNANLLV